MEQKTESMERHRKYSWFFGMNSKIGEHLGMVDMFTILIVVMLSWVYR